MASLDRHLGLLMDKDNKMWGSRVEHDDPERKLKAYMRSWEGRPEEPGSGENGGAISSQAVTGSVTLAAAVGDAGSL